MSRLIDLTGMKFGRLTVLSRAENGVGRSRRWNCKCDCGEIKTVSGQSLKIGTTTSCGCFRKENIKSIKLKHGLSQTDEIKIWRNMIDRCTNNKLRSYKDYGARGITVCERWMESVENFINDMGKRPSKLHTIDRKNVNGNYEPDNCKWSTPTEQARNKRGRSNNPLNIPGVRFESGKWRARITVDDKSIHLGRFNELNDAIKARKDGEIRYWGKPS